MAENHHPPPNIRLESPTLEPNGKIKPTRSEQMPNADAERPNVPSSSQDTKLWKRRPTLRSYTTDQNIYLGSYASSRASLNVRASVETTVPSPRTNFSQPQLELLLPAAQSQLDTYGVEERRDGLFDATFHSPMKRHDNDLRKAARRTWSDSERYPPLSLSRLPEHLNEVKVLLLQLKTRAGIKLLKSFLGCFLAYTICLVPASRNWLGPYNFVMVLSAIVDHPGRSLGAQIEGAVMTSLGTAAGLGWGSLALYISTSTGNARASYGAVLAIFLVLFAITIGWIRSYFIRLYQAVLCAGFAISYTCLANTSSTVHWRKIFDYGIPFTLGQAICLIIALFVFPGTGSGSLGHAFHESLIAVETGLQFPRRENSQIKRDLEWQFVNLSQAVRDFANEITFARLNSHDVRSIRNLVQGVIRSILSIRPGTTLFEDSQGGGRQDIPGVNPDRSVEDLLRLHLGAPIRDLILAMIDTIKAADSVITIMSHRSNSISKYQSADSLEARVNSLLSVKRKFDSIDLQLINSKDLPPAYASQPRVVELLLFIHPVRQTADKVEYFAKEVLRIRQKDPGWRLRTPSYPLWKSLFRTNAQVRHDRGGLTAGFYFRSKHELDRTMTDLQSRAYIPAVRHGNIGETTVRLSAQGEIRTAETDESRIAKLRLRLWSILHRLQGFESRFAFKVTLVATLISVPAWLPQSREWWNANESWWVAVTVWLMMHPRVGGNLVDLFTRCFCVFLGALWAALGNAAGRGSPYVLAVFAATFMLPMLYRFTQSSHPRSGSVGCIAFAVISLDTYTRDGRPSIIEIAWTRGLAFLIGVIAAVTVNWVLWPFVARHECRKSLSSMLLHSAILYRSVIAKYIYYTEGHKPTPEDISRSEMLEGRLREGFVRIRQLMGLTRHETRLRAPFNPLPYSALISTCESFFERLVQVRESSLYFQSAILDPNRDTDARLMTYRRDAVAVILMNLYVLACALRTGRPVPKYLPSAAAARKKLLDRMEVVEAELATETQEEMGKIESDTGKKRRRWADVYRYAFSSALTDIVDELQLLQRYTEETCGEVGWD